MRQFLLGTLALLSGAAHAQAPAWATVQAVAVGTASGASTDNGSDVQATAPDRAGNVYVAGSFKGTATLGNLTLTGAGTSPDNRRMFVAKWLPASGTYAWAVQSSGSQDSSRPVALAVSGGSVYVTGDYGNNSTFGTTVLTTPAGSRDAYQFVAKITDAGTSASFAWAVTAGSNNSGVEALVVNGAAVYLAGNFRSAQASFGPITLTNPNANPSGNPAPMAYVARITDAGSTASFAWAIRMGASISPDGSDANALTMNGTSLYVAGSKSFAGPVFGSPTAVAAGTYVARLNDSGSGASVGWVAAIPSVTGAATPVALVANGPAIYLDGTFRGTVSFGATTLTTTTMASSDFFVTRLTDTGTAGTFAWVTRVGGFSSFNGFDNFKALAVNGNSVFVGGRFDTPTLVLGSLTLTNSGLGSGTGSSTTDAFVAKLTDTGSSSAWAWAKSAGSAGSTTEVLTLALSGSRVFVGGDAKYPTTSFAPLTLPNPTGNYVGFLASLADNTLAAQPTSAAAEPAADLYPNPTRATATLRLPAGAARQPLTLLDALGREVRAYPAPIAAETTLNLRGLPAGLYLLRGAGAAASRLVVD